MEVKILDKNNLPSPQPIPKQALDLTNKRFYNYTVLYYVYSKNQRPYWLCLCDCGNYFIRERSSITRKDKPSKSCGCLSKQVASKTHRNKLIGYKTGKLTVIEDAGINTKDGHSLWKCQCECGNTTIVSSCNLKSGSVQSCGCLGRSSGEYNIANQLTNYNIEFKQEYSFEDLKGDKQKLRFDFAVFKDHNLKFLVEFQGIQHRLNAFQKIECVFAKDLERDKKKKDYCKNHNIPLYEIWYDENLFKKLDEILIKEGLILNGKRI